MSGFKQKTWFIYTLLFFGILCIAWSAVFVKLAAVPGLTSAFYRMFIGTLGLLPLWYLRRRPLNDWESVKTAILCGVFFGVDIAVWNTSIMLSKASISTLLANLAPVWVGIGAIFILKEKPNLLFWIGTLIALAGVVIIVGWNNIVGTNFSFGNVLAITASLFYGAYLLTTRKGRSSLDTISFTGISMVTSTVLLFLVCIFAGVPLVGFSVESWGALAGLGLISQLAGWLVINYSLGHIKPTIASVSLLSQSVFTAIISVPVLKEYLSWIEIAGAGIVLAGIYLVNKRTLRPKIEVEY